MSIVTLKKKTATKYNCMSVGTKTGFSLNGTHRNQGYVGQTMLSRSLPRTLARGATQRGNGGCCGKFFLQPPVISAVTSTENPQVVKPSVLSNDGMIATKYRWIRRPAPITSVKGDNNQNRNTQQDYIDHIGQKTIRDIRICGNNEKTISRNNCFFKSMNSNVKNTCDFTKPQVGPNFIPQNQSDRLLQLCRAPVEKYTNTTSAANHPPIGAPNVLITGPSVDVPKFCCHLPQRSNR